MPIRAALHTLRKHAAQRPCRGLDSYGRGPVLLVELTRLGDVVASLQAVTTLAQRFTDRSLHLMVDMAYASTLRAMKLPITVLGIRGSETAQGIFRAMMVARQLGSTITASMSPARRNAFVALTAGSPVTVGYLGHADSVTPFLSRAPVESYGLAGVEPRVFDADHIQDRGLMVAAALLGNVAAAPNAVALKETEIERVRARIGFSSLTGGDPYAVFHPFARWEYRCWPLHRFVQLARRVMQELHINVMFAGTPDEIRRIPPEASRGIQKDGILLFPSTDLLHTAVLIDGGVLFVGNDSGPLHLAAALQVPVVGLFGPAPPGLTAPRDARGTFLYHALHCSPCTQRSCMYPKRPCMTYIDEDAVFGAVAQIAASPSSRRMAAHV